MDFAPESLNLPDFLQHSVHLLRENSPQLHVPPLDLLQQVHVFLLMRTPELDMVLQLGSQGQQSRIAQDPVVF